MSDENELLKEKIIGEITVYFEKFYPLHKDYKFSRIRFERIFRKLKRHDLSFLKKILAFCQDLQLVQSKIDGIINAPLARQPNFWENLKVLFPEGLERLPEIVLIDGYKGNFRSLILAFLHHNKRHYDARKKTPPTDSSNQVQA